MTPSEVTASPAPDPALVLSWAVWYAQRGWAIVPLWWRTSDGCACGDAGCNRHGSHWIAQLLPNGLADASRDEGRIRAWWSSHPLAGIGVVTGPLSGVVVLGVDPRRGGEEALRVLEARHGALPNSAEARAHDGPRQLWFDCPSQPRPVAEQLGSGLALHAEGDYVVAPPSRLEAGCLLNWEPERGPEVRLASAPDWLFWSSVENLGAAPCDSPAPVPPESVVHVGNVAADVAVALAPLDELGQDPESREVEAALRTIAPLFQGADPLRREFAVAAVTEKLKSLGVASPGALAKAVFARAPKRAAGDDLPGRSPVFRRDPVAENPVDGTALLDDLAAVFRRYLVLPPHVAETLALWTVFTYTMDLAETSPRLWIHSPIRSCGKSRLLTLLDALCLRPIMASSVTPAALFRVISAHQPTILFDEFDNAGLSERPELRAILNSGHTRATASIMKTCGENNEPRQFDTWSPVAFAGIGRGCVTDTLASRSIEIQMQRKLRGQEVAKMRQAALPAEMQPLRSRILRWVADNGTTLRSADPTCPPQLRDRQADNWRPLLAIATAAGGTWPGRAVQAAIELSGAQQETDTSILAQLLGDIRELFDASGRSQLPSAVIVAGLLQREAGAWSSMRNGKGLDKSGLAKLLRDFGIAPKTIRLPEGSTPRGYARADFEDAWERYLAPAAPACPLLGEAAPPVASSGPAISADSAEIRRCGMSASNPGVPFPPAPLPNPNDAA